MTRSTTLIPAAALALLTCVACSNPADNVPAAKVDEASPAPAAPTGEVFTIAEGSTLGFIGSKVTGSHDGGFHQFEGELVVMDNDPTKSHVNLVIDTTSLWSDNDRLTGHLKSADFFEVETYPTATFTSTSIASAPEGGHMVTGNLDLHGVTKSITFPAQITIEPDRVTAQAEFSLMRFDFNIVYPGKPDDLIRDEVVVKFDIVATPAIPEDSEDV